MKQRVTPHLQPPGRPPPPAPGVSPGPTGWVSAELRNFPCGPRPPVFRIIAAALPGWPSDRGEGWRWGAGEMQGAPYSVSSPWALSSALGARGGSRRPGITGEGVGALALWDRAQTSGGGDVVPAATHPPLPAPVTNPSSGSRPCPQQQPSRPSHEYASVACSPPPPAPPLQPPLPREGTYLCW